MSSRRHDPEQPALVPVQTPYDLGPEQPLLSFGGRKPGSGGNVGMSLNSEPRTFWQRYAHLGSLVLMSVGFIGIFTAFSSTQNLMSSLVGGQLGYSSVAVIYAGVMFGSLFFASTVVWTLKPKLSLFFAGLTYAAFEAGNLHPTWWTLMPLAAVLGVGASILWSAQGVYLTAAATNHSRVNGLPVKACMGLFTGVFFCMFQTTQVAGNLLGSMVLSLSADSRDRLFYVYLGVAVLGALIFLLLPKEHNSEDRSPLEGESQWHRLQHILSTLLQRNMLLLLPCLAYSGMELGFVAGDFTNNVVKEVINLKTIGYVMSVFGATNAISSFVLGKLSDVFGKRFVYVVGFCIHGSFFAFLFYTAQLEHPSLQLLRDNEFLLYVMAGWYGIGDAVWNTLPNTLVSIFFAHDTESAFPAAKLFQSFGSVIAFALGPQMTLGSKILMNFSLLTVATGCLAYLDFSGKSNFNHLHAL